MVTDRPFRRLRKLLQTETTLAKVPDLGLLKDSSLASEGDVREGEVVGTLAFMAPEQRLGAPGLDHRADLFAVGAVAYYLLTARLPFTDENGLRTLAAPGPEWPIPPSRHRSDVPADLERVVLRCLTEDPAGRYPDADSLRSAVAACASASEWDAQKARQWWQRMESEHQEPHSLCHRLVPGS